MSNAKGYFIGAHNPSPYHDTGCPVVLRDGSIALPKPGTDGESRRVVTFQSAMAMMSVLVRGAHAASQVLAGAFGNDATMERIEREKFGPRTVTYLGLPGA